MVVFEGLWLFVIVWGGLGLFVVVCYCFWWLVVNKKTKKKVFFSFPTHSY